MTLASIDLGGNGNSFSFETPGDSVTGQIVGIEQVQQTDMQTNQPAFWESGEPKMMIRVDLQTQLRDPANPTDDGQRSVYLKGSRKPESGSSLAAVLIAVRNASGATTLSQGGTLTLTYTGDGVAKQRGFNAPKMYTAVYAPPSMDLAAAPEATPVAAASAPAPVVASAPVSTATSPQATPPQPAAASAALAGGTAQAQTALPPASAPAGMTPEQQAQFAAFQNWNASQAGQPAA